MKEAQLDLEVGRAALFGGWYSRTGLGLPPRRIEDTPADEQDLLWVVVLVLVVLAMLAMAISDL